jgi:hypothetical protein
LTPSNIKASQETGLTSSTVAVRSDHTVLFWQAFGRNLMEVVYSLEQDSYVTTPLTVLAEHIGYYPIIEMTFLQEPLGSVWCIRNDGQIAVLTYERQHKVIAWSRIKTDGYFESIARIPGADRDEIWVMVRRTIGGGTVRYIELLEDLEIYEESDVEDVFYVDSGLTYDGVPATVISGLDHLNGETVAILADGSEQREKVVAAGSITLDYAASVVQVGLKYTSIIKPVRLEMKVQGSTIQNRRQRIVTVGLRMYKTYGLNIGEALDDLTIVPFRTTVVVMGDPVILFTGDKRIQFAGSYNREGQLYITHTMSLPFNLLAIMPKLDLQP